MYKRQPHLLEPPAVDLPVGEGRRDGGQFGVAAAATLFAVPRSNLAFAQAPAGPFTLPPLPYAPDANEPSIDKMTMEIHHDRHHAAYVANLNNAAKDYPQIAAMPLQDVLAKIAQMPEGVRTALRNNGCLLYTSRCV